ncbi:hypothetical protein QE152_g33285 [Popillia japonica]|uniref:Uncharacterized protein n=1 Tax=Popillia japonica TaxID=7064 RepID=A0AAW1IX96_POPJA
MFIFLVVLDDETKLKWRKRLEGVSVEAEKNVASKRLEGVSVEAEKNVASIVSYGSEKIFVKTTEDLYGSLIVGVMSDREQMESWCDE